MTYREVYNTLTKEAGLDKKALMGPLAFLRKNPGIIKRIWDMPVKHPDSYAQWSKLLTLSNGLDKEAPTLANVLWTGGRTKGRLPQRKYNLIKSWPAAGSLGLLKVFGIPAELNSKDRRLYQRFLTALNHDPASGLDHISGPHNTMNLVESAKGLRLLKTLARERTSAIKGPDMTSGAFLRQYGHLFY